MHPSPPPGPAGPDNHGGRSPEREWREINAHLPNWLICHPYNDMLGDGLPECERTWAFDFPRVHANRVVAGTHGHVDRQPAVERMRSTASTR